MPPSASFSSRGATIRRASFLVLVVLTTLAFLALLREFLVPVLWAAVLATIFFPLQRWYAGRLGGRPSPAAVATILTIVSLVVVPLSLVGLALSREVVQLQRQIANGTVDPRAPLRAFQRFMPAVTDSLAAIGVDVEGLIERLSDSAVTITQFIAVSALGFGQGVLRFIALFFLMLYLLFFFLRDGRQLVGTIVRVLPLGEARVRQLLAKFADVSLATIKGTVVVGIVQGLIGGLLFWILGISAPVFWGAVMAILSILPAVGPGLVWAPAALILLGSGELLKGSVLIVGGILGIGLVDNLLRPILVGRDTQMPDYLVLLSTLGGLQVFGVSGFVLGPVIAALFLVVWEMFARDYTARAVEKSPHDSSAA